MRIFVHTVFILCSSIVYGASTSMPLTQHPVERCVEHYVRPLADLATAAVCKQYVQFSIVDFNRQNRESIPVDTPIINANRIAKRHPRGGWVSEIQLQPIQPVEERNQQLTQKLLELLHMHIPFVARAFYLFCESTKSANGNDQRYQYLSHDPKTGFLMQELTEERNYYKRVTPKLGYSFRNCRLTSLVGADELQDFAKTQLLDLAQNKLNYASFKPLLSLPHVISIDLEQNLLEHIPDEIFKLTGLISLRLNLNKISVIPPAIAALTNLRVLALNCNRIAELSEEFKHLEILATFRIDGNRLTSLPMDTFKDFKYLESVYASGNPIPENLKITYLKQAEQVGFKLTLTPEYGEAGYLA